MPYGLKGYCFVSTFVVIMLISSDNCIRHGFSRLVEEAKCMSSENIKVRKQLNGERERWRVAERSRVAKEHRRQMEVERKTDDVHALRYR